jgi:hypothetical protein
VNRTIFWDTTPRSTLKLNRRFGGIYRPHIQGRRICRTRNQLEGRWQAEATCFSETSVDFHHTTRRCIPGHSTLHNHRCENRRSYEVFKYAWVAPRTTLRGISLYRRRAKSERVTYATCVILATWAGADGFSFSYRLQSIRFCKPTASRLAQGPTQPPIQWVLFPQGHS